MAKEPEETEEVQVDISDLEGLGEIELLKMLRKGMLKEWIRQMRAGKLSSTDAATITRLATQNGWVLDETRLPTRLKDKLTSHFDPADIDPADDKVIPIRASGGKKSA